MRRAVGLLLGAVALATAAGTLASLALFALAVGLLVVTAAAGASVLLAAHRMVVIRWVLEREVREDQPIGVRFEVRGRGRLPMPVYLEAQVDADAWVPLGERGGTLQLTVGRRGAWQLGPSRLRLRDGLGIFAWSVAAGQPEPLLVLPAPDLRVPVPPRSGAWAGDPDPDGLQPYVPGIPIGRVHWPALARGAGLQQRRLAPPPSGLPLVLVDTTRASDPRAVDWAARVAAGVILRLAGSGGCRVLLPGHRTATTVTDTAAGWRGVHRRLAGGLLAVWLPAGVLAAGAPAGQLLPQAWPGLLAHLIEGAQRLTALGSGSGPIGDDRWPLAAWLLLAGAIWVAGATLAASGPSARRRAIAFGLLAAPWIAAVAARQTDRAAWQGAAVLLAGLLWFADWRVAVRPALALGLAAAVVSVGAAQAIGPRERWFTPASLFASAPPFRTLQTELTYGPLQGRRSGATMLEVTAAEPALWRMRVLDVFVEDVWGVRPGATPELPQPAARVVEATVEVRGLRNDLVVAPGRIDAIRAAAKVSQGLGEAWQLTPPARRGDTYQVRATLVRPTAEQLRGAPAPTDDARLPSYTDLYVRRDQGDAADQAPQAPADSWRHRPEPPVDSWHRVNVPLFGQPRDPQVTAVLDRTPYGPVAALARQLAAGAATQWEVVARVHRYLLDGGHFRYTTNLPQAGPFPLVDFLLRGHAGYCQHFAGAAALLLRLAGVPTRVVVGFATGVRQPDGRFTVRDVDAHAWIEVYFQGYGWVPFNPTPPAAQAQIPRQLDPLAPAPATMGGGHHVRGGLGGLAVGALLAVLATVGAVLVRGRRRGRCAELGQLLEGLVRRTGGHVRTSSTLAEVSVELMRLVGPNTAALAAQAERARFAPDSPMPSPRPRIQVARALAKDLGPMWALIVLVAPAATRRAHNGRRGSPLASAGASRRARRRGKRYPPPLSPSLLAAHRPSGADNRGHGRTETRLGEGDLLEPTELHCRCLPETYRLR